MAAMKITTNTNSTTQEHVLLGNWNDQLISALMPCAKMLFCFIVIGVFGNATVIYIYKFKFHHYNEDRYFIPHLAMIDLFAVVICPINELMAYYNPVMYTNTYLCKTFQTLELFGTGFSALVLCIIAINRYQKICTPFKSQMTLSKKRFMLLSAFVFMLILAAPTFFISGIKQTEKYVMNVTGYYCSEVALPETDLFPQVYNIAIMLICVGNLCLMCVLYTLVLKVIFRHVRKKKLREKSSETATQLQTFTKSKSRYREPTNIENKESSKGLQTAMHRMSVMFSIITFIYVLCFIPATLYLVWISFGNTWLTKSGLEMFGFKLARNSFMINNIVNPIIYGVFDKSFRRELVSVFQCC